MKKKVKKQLNNYYRRKQKMDKVNIPFMVNDVDYSINETKMKDAETLKALQEIAIGLSKLNDTLSKLNLNCNDSKTKKK